jgi:hypothetical protein
MLPLPPGTIIVVDPDDHLCPICRRNPVERAPDKSISMMPAFGNDGPTVQWVLARHEARAPICSDCARWVVVIDR